MSWASLMDIPLLPTGNSQGYFRYYKTDGTYEEIVAIDGLLYKNAVLLPITGISSFQSTEQIGAVQYAGTLYIATGTKLLQYDGTTCKVVDAYLPTTMEMTYVGTNALSDNPEGHLTDTSGLVPAIDYVYPSKPTGVINTAMTVKVYCTKIDGETYEYATQIQKSSSSTDFPDPAPSAFKALGSDRSISVKNVGTSGDYTIRVSMRRVSETVLLAQYDMEYTINKVADDKANKVAKPTIHQCNRATVYWGRLALYGDPANPSLVYLSQTNQPNYMPSLLTIDFENPKREPLNQLLQYRNGLLAFTDSSTQFLTGTSPDDYVRHMLHTDLGCISPKGAVTMTNNVAFLSQQGIYTLTIPTYTQSTTDDKANVNKIDLKIRNIVPLDKNAIAIFDNNQLQMTFPGSKMRLRYYLDYNSWAKDESDKFDFANMWNFNGDIHAQSGNMVYHFDKEVYTDDHENFINSFESKNFTFNQPYHEKKLKEFQILVAPKGQEMTSTVQVYADSAIVMGDEEQGYATVNENDEVEWKLTFEPNLDVPSSTTFGDWKLGTSPFGETDYAKKEFRIAGKCLRTRVKFSNTEAKENHVVGFSYIFKVKRPR